MRTVLFLFIFACLGFTPVADAESSEKNNSNTKAWVCDMDEFTWTYHLGQITVEHTETGEVVFSSESGAILKSWENKSEPGDFNPTRRVVRLTSLGNFSLNYRVETDWFYPDGTTAHSQVNSNQYQILRSNPVGEEFGVKYKSVVHDPEGGYSDVEGQRPCHQEYQ